MSSQRSFSPTQTGSLPGGSSGRISPVSSASSPPPEDDLSAIVGMACRVPGAQNPSKLWENIVNKRDMQKKMPEDRFNVDAFYNVDGANKGTVSQFATLPCLNQYLSIWNCMLRDSIRPTQSTGTSWIKTLATSMPASSEFLATKPRPWILSKGCSSKLFTRRLKTLASRWMRSVAPRHLSFADGKFYGHVHLFSVSMLTPLIALRTTTIA